MKSNMILSSSDRQLFGVTIRQNTKEEFLSVTDLQKAYEKGKWQYGWTGQTVNQLLLTDELAKKCYGVLLEANLIKCDMLKFMEMVKESGLVTVLKGLGVYKVTGRGENKQVMAHPYIWLSIAIELNYILYGKVIKWVSDSLIFDRVEAGSEYLPMNAAIKSVVEKPNYSNYAMAINEKVFGIHQTGMRNLASAKELRKIADIEKFITNAIEQKWISTETQIIAAIVNYK
ncbi:MAG: hypothetical protein RLZZ605_1483 [Bacteroidota bacterium]|jgi:hypothetical protein